MVGRPPVDNRGKAGRRRGPQPAVDRRTPRKYACCACCRSPASVKGLTPRHPLTVTHRKAVRADVRAPGHSRDTASMTRRRVTSHAWGALPSAEWMRSKGGRCRQRETRRTEDVGRAVPLSGAESREREMTRTGDRARLSLTLVARRRRCGPAAVLPRQRGRNRGDPRGRVCPIGAGMRITTTLARAAHSAKPANLARPVAVRLPRRLRLTLPRCRSAPPPPPPVSSERPGAGSGPASRRHGDLR
jgi:hypothetical protein